MPEHGTGSSQSNPSCRQSFPTRGLQAAPVHHQNFILNCAAYSISLIQLVLERSLKQDSNCYSLHIPMWTLVLWVSRRIGWWNLCGRINPSRIAYCIKIRFLCSTKKIVYEKHRPSAKSRVGYALFVIMECSVNAWNLIMSKLCLRIIYLQELQETGLPVSLTKEHL